MDKPTMSEFDCDDNDEVVELQKQLQKINVCLSIETMALMTIVMEMILSKQGKIKDGDMRREMDRLRQVAATVYYSHVDKKPDKEELPQENTQG